MFAARLRTWCAAASGRALDGRSATSEIAAQDDGRRTSPRRRRARSRSAPVYAGVAGALYVFAIGFVAPESFTLAVSFAFLAAIVVGGLATISGAVFGALFIEFVPVYASDVNEALAGVIYGGGADRVHVRAARRGRRAAAHGRELVARRAGGGARSSRRRATGGEPDAAGRGRDDAMSER